MLGGDCGQACYDNTECTHFTWTLENGGTCQLKYGPVSRADAFATGDINMVCGTPRETPHINRKGTITVTFPANATIDWKGNNWAKGCDFRNNNLATVAESGDNCGQACIDNLQCTHFTWTMENGGTCQLKYGPVSKADALPTGDMSMVCGVSKETPQKN